MLDEECRRKGRSVMETGAPVTVTTGADLEVKGAVDLVLFRSVDACQMLCHVFQCDWLIALIVGLHFGCCGRGLRAGVVSRSGLVVVVCGSFVDFLVGATRRRSFESLSVCSHIIGFRGYSSNEY